MIRFQGCIFQTSRQFSKITNTFSAAKVDEHPSEEVKPARWNEVIENPSPEMEQARRYQVSVILRFPEGIIYHQNFRPGFGT